MKRLNKFVCLMLISLFLPTAVFAGSVPRAAAQAADQLDAQIMRRIGEAAGGRANLSIAATVPVNLHNLNETSPLARQFTEEVIGRLVEAGYRVFELRKGSQIKMDNKGEKILSRNLNQLPKNTVKTVAVLTGTYTVTSENVRFNLRLLYTPNDEVLAMGSATISIIDELQPLLSDRNSKSVPKPTVFTRLP